MHTQCVNNKNLLSLDTCIFLQYLYWKQMSKAATLIQNKYRRYCEHKRFKKSQEAATCIQNYYRTYKEHQGQSGSRSRESTPSAGIKWVHAFLKWAHAQQLTFTIFSYFLGELTLKEDNTKLPKRFSNLWGNLTWG